MRIRTFCNVRTFAAIFSVAIATTCLGPRALILADGAVQGPLPRVFFCDPSRLDETRRKIAQGDKALAPAIDRLRGEAREALKSGPFSVMQKKIVPPSGDKHDYMSVGPYWWPDPTKPDGLPYIRRDGEVNPEWDHYDIVFLHRMTSAVDTLALAWYLTGEEPYAEHAARLLRAWFLDPATRMNPNLEFGQGVPGRSIGRGTGIIDTRELAWVADSIGLVRGSKGWTDADQRGMEAWYGSYLDWLLKSKYGKDEARATNNHGTWYDVQVARFALFAGREDLAREVLRAVPTKRIAAQIKPDGTQPAELARTKALGYSTMNLRGMFDLAALGDRVGVDLWRFETADGRSIRKALDWLAPFVVGEKPWKHQQIASYDAAAFFPLFRRAALAYGDPRYEQLAPRLPGGPFNADRANLLYPAQ